jgi:predicted MFS family arabinose efflux permease
MTFCPVLIKEIFHAEVSDFGNTMAAFGFGGLVGAGVSLIPFPPTLKRDRVASFVAIFLGLLVFTIALNRSLFFLSALMILAGMALTVSNISGSTFLQENSGNQNRGKIVSLYQLAMQGGISAGGLVTGIMASQFGIASALLVNGLIAIAFQIVILFQFSTRAELHRE